VLITELLTPLQLKNTKQTWKNTDSKIINIAICKTCKKSLLDVENMILIRYYYETAKTRALYESTDGPAGQPVDNPPNPDRLGDVHQTVPELMVRVYRRPRQQMWKGVGLDPDLKPKRRSGTIANTSYGGCLELRLSFYSVVQTCHILPTIRATRRNGQYI